MQHPNDDITQGLIDVDIKATYQAVVEFIQEHNNQDTEAEACDMLYGVDNNQ
jgi:nanoRNase/pAp phosphatase (c-di-AMP/oligoRNAs hydrolase)